MSTWRSATCSSTTPWPRTPHPAAYAPKANAAQQRAYLTHLHQTLNAPSHPISNRLLRLTADSPDLPAIIKAEGKV